MTSSEPSSATSQRARIGCRGRAEPLARPYAADALRIVESDLQATLKALGFARIHSQLCLGPPTLNDYKAQTTTAANAGIRTS